MRMFFTTTPPASVAASIRGARHAAARATLYVLALMLIPGTACGRNNDIPRDGITAAIPAGWILLPPDPSRPGKQLVAPDGEGRLVVDVTPADGDDAARMNAYASRDGEKSPTIGAAGAGSWFPDFAATTGSSTARPCWPVRILGGTRSSSNTLRRRSGPTTGS